MLGSVCDRKSRDWRPWAPIKSGIVLGIEEWCLISKSCAFRLLWKKFETETSFRKNSEIHFIRLLYHIYIEAFACLQFLISYSFCTCWIAEKFRERFLQIKSKICWYVRQTVRQIEINWYAELTWHLRFTKDEVNTIEILVDVTTSSVQD